MPLVRLRLHIINQMMKSYEVLNASWLQNHEHSWLALLSTAAEGKWNRCVIVSMLLSVLAGLYCSALH